MKNNGLTIFLMLALVLGASPAARADCQDGGGGGGEVLGTLLGAAIGGLVGSQIGSGTGNKVAIGAGVLAGGLLGNKIGKSMGCEDQARHAETANRALETQPTGTTASWKNPDTGYAGTVTPTRTWQDPDGTYCREFEQTITIDGRIEQATGTACRQDDGRWEIVSR